MLAAYHRDKVTAAAFSPDGARVVTAGSYAAWARSTPAMYPASANSSPPAGRHRDVCEHDLDQADAGDEPRAACRRQTIAELYGHTAMRACATSTRLTPATPSSRGQLAVGSSALHLSGSLVFFLAQRWGKHGAEVVAPDPSPASSLPTSFTRKHAPAGPQCQTGLVPSIGAGHDC